MQQHGVVFHLKESKFAESFILRVLSLISD